MSVSKWRYEKECDGRPCVGDCDLCDFDPWEERNCGNCKHQAELIMRERIQRGEEMAYLPNYNKPLTCCAVMALDEDGIVYGHTEPHDDGLCEMWGER